MIEGNCVALVMSPIFFDQEATVDRAYDSSYPIFLVGEGHAYLASKELFAASMPGLKHKGIQHLAKEYSSNFQESVDRFLQGRCPRGKVIQAIKKSSQFEQIRPGHAEREVRIIEAAHSAGIQVHCIDMAWADQNKQKEEIKNFYGQSIARLGIEYLRERLSDAELTQRLQRIHVQRLAMEEQLILDRNRQMSERLLSFKEPVVFHGGRNHTEKGVAFRESNLCQFLDEKVRYMTLSFAGCYKVSADAPSRVRLRCSWEYEAVDRQLDQAIFLATDNRGKVDYVLHLAQIGGVLPFEIFYQKEMTLEEFKKNADQVFAEAIERGNSPAPEPRSALGIKTDDFNPALASPRSGNKPDLDTILKNLKTPFEF